MDAYSGYNQILMVGFDVWTWSRSHLLHHLPRAFFCYTIVSFSLKNVGATYQRLVMMMFKEYIGDTLKVYIGDMVVKSMRWKDHLEHLDETFQILKGHRMILNLAKFIFEIPVSNFIINQSGIKLCPNFIKASRDMPSPKTIRKIQRLSRRVTTLSRFITRSARSASFNGGKTLNGLQNAGHRFKSSRNI